MKKLPFILLFVFFSHICIAQTFLRHFESIAVDSSVRFDSLSGNPSLSTTAAKSNVFYKGSGASGGWYGLHRATGAVVRLDSAGGGSLWSRVGNYLYPLNITDSVAIGRQNTKARLQVHGAVIVADTTMTGTPPTNAGLSLGGTKTRVEFMKVGSTSWGAVNGDRFSLSNSNSNNRPFLMVKLQDESSIPLAIDDSGYTYVTPKMVVSQGGGLGSYRPWAAFEVGPGNTADVVFTGANFTPPSSHTAGAVWHVPSTLGRFTLMARGVTDLGTTTIGQRFDIIVDGAGFGIYPFQGPTTSLHYTALGALLWKPEKREKSPEINTNADGGTGASHYYEVGQDTFLTNSGIAVTFYTVSIPTNGDVYTIEIDVQLSADTSAGVNIGGAHYQKKASFNRLSGAVNQIGGTTLLHVVEDRPSSTWDADFQISSTNVNIIVTGTTQHSIQWAGRIKVWWLNKP